MAECQEACAFSQNSAGPGREEKSNARVVVLVVSGWRMRQPERCECEDIPSVIVDQLAVSVQACGMPRGLGRMCVNRSRLDIRLCHSNCHIK